MNTLPGTFQAAWRGLTFHVPDISTSVGRRLAEHLFPGVNQAAYDDMGEEPELVQLSGLIVGDDYVIRANAMRGAFAQPGPGTLVHPWYGPMRAILETPATISFSDRELRVARFDASFKVIKSGAAGPGRYSTTGLVLSSLTRLANRASELISAVDHITQSRLRYTALVRVAQQARTVFSDLLPTFQAPSDSSSEFVASLTTELNATVDALAYQTSTPVVAPAAEAVESEAGTGLFEPTELELEPYLNVAAAFLDLSRQAPSYTDQALLEGSATICISSAARAALSVRFRNRGAAFAYRQRIEGLVEDLIEPHSQIAAGRLLYDPFASQRSLLEREASQLAATIGADINEVIGSLDQVHVHELPRTADGFALAHHIFGDEPDQVEAGYQAIIERNRPRHPARVPAGPVEVPQ